MGKKQDITKSIIKTARFHHITADKKEIKDFPKLPAATSFICKMLYEIRQHKKEETYEKFLGFWGDRKTLPSE